jgi:hypothetical protein
MVKFYDIEVASFILMKRVLANIGGYMVAYCILLASLELRRHAFHDNTSSVDKLVVDSTPI